MKAQIRIIIICILISAPIIGWNIYSTVGNVNSYRNNLEYGTSPTSGDFCYFADSPNITYSKCPPDETQLEPRIKELYKISTFFIIGLLIFAELLYGTFSKNVPQKIKFWTTTLLLVIGGFLVTNFLTIRMTCGSSLGPDAGCAIGYAWAIPFIYFSSDNIWSFYFVNIVISIVLSLCITKFVIFRSARNQRSVQKQSSDDKLS